MKSKRGTLKKKSFRGSPESGGVIQKLHQPAPAAHTRCQEIRKKWMYGCMDIVMQVVEDGLSETMVKTVRRLPNVRRRFHFIVESGSMECYSLEEEFKGENDTCVELDKAKEALERGRRYMWTVSTQLWVRMVFAMEGLCVEKFGRMNPVQRWPAYATELITANESMDVLASAMSHENACILTRDLFHVLKTVIPVLTPEEKEYLRLDDAIRQHARRTWELVYMGMAFRLGAIGTEMLEWTAVNRNKKMEQDAEEAQ